MSKLISLGSVTRETKGNPVWNFTFDSGSSKSSVCYDINHVLQKGGAKLSCPSVIDADPRAQCYTKAGVPLTCGS